MSRVSWPFYGWAVDFRVPESRIGQSGEHCSINKLGHKNSVFMADISSILSGVYEYSYPTQGQGYES